jgi:hypothetical protein
MKDLVVVSVILLIIMGAFWYLNPEEFYKSAIEEAVIIPVILGLIHLSNKMF